MKKYFPAGADRAVWIVTCSLIAFALVVLVIAGAVDMPSSALIVLYSVAGLVGLVLLLGWLARPVRYEVRDTSVSIARAWPFRSTTIQKSEVKEARHLKLDAVRPSSISIAWIFGYAGRFASKDAGEFLFFGTNPSNAVLISAKEKYVLTPANPKRFLNDVTGKK